MKARSILIGVIDFTAMIFLAGCYPGTAAPADPAIVTELPVPVSSDPTAPVPPAVEPTVPSAPAVRAIAAGWGFTLALTEAGAVKCWGSGYVCDGSTVNKNKPVDKLELSSGVVAVTAGGQLACALTSGGGVKCWGANNFGQLGNGMRDDSSSPVDVAGLSGGVIAVSAGGSHACALTSAGGVKCWGQNDFGQLGDGTMNTSRTPVDVAGLSGGVRAVSAGGSHTCALMEGGGVKCWGYNGNGQLGNSDMDSQEGRYHSTPADVEGLTDAVEVAAGFAVTCARTAIGGVKCWGQRGNGQLGDGVVPEGQKESSGVPVDVLSLAEGTTAITAGMVTSCAVNGAGAVFCWGGLSTGVSFSPVPIEGLTGGVIAVAIGEMHICVLTGAGAVKCWGKNAVGQLGDGTTEDRAAPVDVVGLR